MVFTGMVARKVGTRDIRDPLRAQFNKFSSSLVHEPGNQNLVIGGHKEVNEGA